MQNNRFFGNSLFAILLTALLPHAGLGGETSPQKTTPLPDDSIYQISSEWTDQNQKKLKLSDLAGKNVVVSMIYMKCQYSCPLTIARMKEVEKALTPVTLAKTRFVLISFDTKNDTPEVMLNYAKKNHLDLAQWTFLAGSNEQNVREFSTLIDFKYKKLESGEFEHSYAIVALDSEGRIVERTEGAEMNPKAIATRLNQQTKK